MNRKETLKYLRAEARKLGLTLLEQSLSCGKCYRFNKRGNRTNTLTIASSLGMARAWVDSGYLSKLVAKLKDKDLF